MRRRARGFLHSLKGKGVILVLGAIVVTVLIETVVSVVVGRLLLSDQVEDQLTTTASIVEQDLDDKLRTRFQAISRAASRIRMDSEALRSTAPFILQNDTALLTLFNTAYVADAGGRIIADQPHLKGRIGLDISDHNYFKLASTQLTTVISQPFTTQLDSHPAIAVAAPIFNSRGRFVGVLVGVTELDSQSFIGRLQRIPVGHSGYISVGTLTGLTIAHPDKTRILQPLPRNEALDLARKNQDGIAIVRTPQGAEAVYAFRQLTEAPWFVSVVIPAQEAFKALERVTESEIAASIAVLVLIAIIAWRVLGRLLQPLGELETQMELRHTGLRTGPVRVHGSAEIQALATMFNTTFEDRSRALESLSEREAFFRTITEAAPLGILQTNVMGRVQFANAAVLKILGLSWERLMGQSWLKGLVPEDRDRVAAEWQIARQTHKPLFSQFRVQTPEQKIVWVEAVASTIQSSSVTHGFIAIIRDITHERDIEAQLEDERSRADRVLGLLRDGVLVIDPSGRISYANGPGEAFVCNDCSVVGGKLFEMITVEVDGEQWSLERLLEHPELENLDALIIDRNQRRHEVELTMLRLNHSSAESDRIVFVLRDDSERRRREERLSWEATHDALTGLNNRRAFMASLVHWLGESHSLSQVSVLAMIDLDYFKQVNDEGGHLLGDELLRNLAETIRLNIRQTDIAARLGGDEFSVLLPGCGMERAIAILEQIRAAVESLRIERDGKSYGVTTSIGVTVLAENDQSPRVTLARADEGCYRVKASGRNGIATVMPLDPSQP
ncbi:diguanylate cyclase [Mangrovitalea sediminis]|uniref:diguanylate cyclase n=1 Tax=Mangrovitalea sediminis TaxID=1982043 RepID=UPI000BE55437|nr:diguanylate cyclase [Mangrovitalea sediminis]